MLGGQPEIRRMRASEQSASTGVFRASPSMMTELWSLWRRCDTVGAGCDQPVSQAS
jgi:hypothetical protein